jgi:hypothetical protein
LQKETRWLYNFALESREGDFSWYRARISPTSPGLVSPALLFIVVDIVLSLCLYFCIQFVYIFKTLLKLFSSAFNVSLPQKIYCWFLILFVFYLWRMLPNVACYIITKVSVDYYFWNCACCWDLLMEEIFFSLFSILSSPSYSTLL